MISGGIVVNTLKFTINVVNAVLHNFKIDKNDTMHPLLTLNITFQYPKTE